MVNKPGFLIHKANHKDVGMTIYSIYKENHPVIPNKVVKVFDQEYLIVEKTFQNKNHRYLREREGISRRYCP